MANKRTTPLQESHLHVYKKYGLRINRKNWGASYNHFVVTPYVKGLASTLSIIDWDALGWREGDNLTIAYLSRIKEIDRLPNGINNLFLRNLNLKSLNENYISSRLINEKYVSLNQIGGIDRINEIDCKSLEVENCSKIRTIDVCKKLQRLTILSMDNLETINRFPSSLDTLYLNGLPSLKTIPKPHYTHIFLQDLSIRNCIHIKDFTFLNNIRMCYLLEFDSMDSLKGLPIAHEIQSDEVSDSRQLLYALYSGSYSTMYNFYNRSISRKEYNEKLLLCNPDFAQFIDQDKITEKEKESYSGIISASSYGVI